MAVIPVEKKSGSSQWMWLIGLLVLLVVIWFVWQMFDRDPETMNTVAPAAVTSTETAPPAATNGSMTAPEVAATETDTTTPPADATATGSTLAGAPTGATGSAQSGGTAAADRVTDAGAFASTSDKLSLVGREAVFSDVRVVRVVGPKSFTLASGSEEFLVMVDPSLDWAVGTQGQIAPGMTINLKGNFQRLQVDEINTISSNRIRDLTEQEREWLRKTQVYLHATELGKGS
jgi:hypothetical protein